MVPGKAQCARCRNRDSLSIETQGLRCGSHGSCRDIAHVGEKDLNLLVAADRNILSCVLVMEVRLALAVVHEPEAVVVALLVLAAVLQAVALDNIQECLHTGIHTCVCRVGIELQHQERLGPHDPLKVVEHE